MNCRTLALITGHLGVIALLATPLAATAQECEGSEPRGGRWATSAELYLEKGQQNPDPQEKRERFQQALGVLEDGFEEQPGNPRNYLYAGQAYVGLGDYEGADSMYAHAVELWSCYSGRVDTLRYNAWVRAFNQAVRYAESGDMEKAGDAYSQAWTIYKELPQPQIQLGSIYAQRALDADSIAEREAAQENAIEAYRAALTALEKGNPRVPEEDREDFGRAAAFNLAQLLALDERFREAATAYDRFLAENPGNVDALVNAAVVLTRAYQQAADSARDLEEGSPERQTLTEEGQQFKQKAVDYYAQLLERDDLTADMYHNAGVGLARLQEYDQAVTAFTKALDLAPYSHRSLTQLGLVLFEAGRHDSLVVVAEELVERYPLNLNNLALLANSYRELDQREDALAILERREELPAEVVDLTLEAEEGLYTLKGTLVNRSLEPGAEMQLRFNFYNDLGELITDSSVAITAPEQGQSVAFNVPVESAVPISGYSYEMVSEAAEATES